MAEKYSSVQSTDVLEKYNKDKLPAQACANILFKSAHTSTGNLFFYLY